MDMKLKHIKVMACGDLVEIYNYENPRTKIKTSKGGRRFYTDSPSIHHEKYRLTAIKRAKSNLFSLIRGNFPLNSSFVTFTFSDKSKVNFCNISSCQNELRNFIRRLRRYLKKNYPQFTSGLKYIAVTEFQEKNSREATHFHMVSNLPYIRHSILQDLWGHGFIWIETCNDYGNKHKSISAYLSKNFFDHRLDGRRKFIRSKGLHNPRELTLEETSQLFSSYHFQCSEPVKIENYENPFLGLVNYEAYIIPGINQEVLQ